MNESTEPNIFEPVVPEAGRDLENPTAADEHGPGSEAQQAARERLASLLKQARISDFKDSDLEKILYQQSGPYSAALYFLSHLAFEEEAAAHHWHAIQWHREMLSERVGRDIGASVATLDYFHNMRRDLTAPTIVEQKDFDATQRSAMADALTGLFNRRYFQTSLEREVERAQRYAGRFSLVMFDLDDFKQVNDRFGHVIGDEALVRVSAIICKNLRQVDVPCRFGGEEFALILPGTDQGGAAVLADRIREEIQRTFGDEEFFGHRLGLTMSGGVATCPDDATSSKDLTRHADHALYRSKRLGKNQVAVAGTPERGPETAPPPLAPEQSREEPPEDDLQSASFHRQAEAEAPEQSSEPEVPAENLLLEPFEGEIEPEPIEPEPKSETPEDDLYFAPVVRDPETEAPERDSEPESPEPDLETEAPERDLETESREDDLGFAPLERGSPTEPPQHDLRVAAFDRDSQTDAAEGQSEPEAPGEDAEDSESTELKEWLSV